MVKLMNDETLENRIATSIAKIDPRVADELFACMQLERSRQNMKFPSQERQREVSIDKWMVILGEEVGELMKAVLEHDNTQILSEAVEVCAVVQRILEVVPELRYHLLSGSTRLKLEKRRNETTPAEGHF